MTTHAWDKKFAEGQAGARFLDGVFGPFHAIRPATREEQRRGIDRWFEEKDTGRWFPVEYKTDRRAFETGNAFVETTSVDTVGKRGWALTSQAEMLAYYLPDADLVYWLRMERVREQLPRWQRTFRTRAAQNEGYQTLGLLVPLAEFERYADEVIQTGAEVTP